MVRNTTHRLGLVQPTILNKVCGIVVTRKTFGDSDEVTGQLSLVTVRSNNHLGNDLCVANNQPHLLQHLLGEYRNNIFILNLMI